MKTKVYTVIIEVSDSSNSDGEDIEEIIQNLFDGDLPEGLPRDLSASIVEVQENEE